MMRDTPTAQLFFRLYMIIVSLAIVVIALVTALAERPAEAMLIGGAALLNAAYWMWQVARGK